MIHTTKRVGVYVISCQLIPSWLPARSCPCPNYNPRARSCITPFISLLNIKLHLKPCVFNSCHARSLHFKKVEISPTVW